MDDHVGLGQSGKGIEREEARITRTSASEPDVPGRKDRNSGAACG
jgi:hypothetical protein